MALARLVSPVLVGRDGELDLLLAAATDPPALALVEGEAGIGKTRLVEELLARPELRAHHRLVGRSHQLSEPFPLGPVMEALREARPAPAALNPVVGALRPHLPELSPRLPTPPDPIGDPRAERHRVFRAVRELLHALGHCVLVLEDLHWADRATLELVRFLVPQLPSGLTLVCTYRRGDLPEDSSLPGLSGHLASEARGAHVALRPLDTDQVRAQVATILGIDEVSKEFAEYLVASSGGLPFAVEEILKLLESREDLVRLDGLWVRRSLEELEVPAALQDSLLERLAGLSPEAQDVVRAAAILGVPSTDAALLVVAALPDEPATRGLTEALSSALLLEVSEAHFGFRHVLARQAVEEAIPSPLRRRLHLRAARLLEAAEPKQLARLAHHYRAAGATRKWIRYAEAAADRAKSLEDDATAFRFLKEAVSVDGLAPATRGRLAAKLATHGLHCLAHTEAIEVLSRLLEDETLPAGHRGQVRLSLAVLLYQAGDTSAFFSETARALDDLSGRPALAARAMAKLGLPWNDEWPMEEHLRWLDRAAKTARGTKDREVKMIVADHLAVTLLSFGDPEGWRAVEKIPPPSTAAEETKHAVAACVNLSDAALHLGHYARAGEFIRKGFRLAAESGFARGATALTMNELQLDWLAGNWRGLEARARSLAEAMEDWPHMRAVAETVLGLLSIAQGKAAFAVRVLEPLSGDFPGGVVTRTWVVGGLGRIRLAQGKAGSALDGAADVLGIVRRKGVWAWATEVAPVTVEALLQTGRRAEAGEVTHEFEEGLAGRDAPAASAALMVCSALLADAEGEASRAAGRYLDAERAWLALPRPYEAARAKAAAGRRLLGGGDESGGELLVEAADAFRKLGASWDAAGVRRLLREHGILPPNRRGRKGYGDQLSPREAEVARLAGEGLGNREIALALFLSPKTVEKHVAAAMRKVGASSRDELPGSADAAPPPVGAHL
jgi:DNA-binding NarL/FixJ family response regulator